MVAVAGSSSASYVYDGGGRRARQTVGSNSYDYVYDLSGRAITQLNPGWAWSQLYAGGLRVGTYYGGTTTFEHSDWQGTVRAHSNVAGASAETCTSLSFGDAQTCTSPDWSQVHFTGQPRDAESNLDHFWFRQYSSTQGRWMMPDPAGLEAVNPADPQSWNRYAYVTNNPLSFTDPLGLCDSLVCTEVWAPSDCPIGTAFDGNQCQQLQMISYDFPVGRQPPGLRDWLSKRPATFFPGYVVKNPANTATISAIHGYEGSKKQFCDRQANLAALDSLLPGLANAIQADYRSIAATATSEVAQDLALDAAAKSTPFLLTVRSLTGIPKSVTSKVLSGIGYVGTTVNLYGAMKAMQTEYAACMQ